MAATFSSREFTRDVSAAKRAAAEGPVFITDRGRPAFALLKIEDYQHLIEPGRSIADMLTMPEGGDEIEFTPPRLRGDFAPADLG